MELLHIDNNSGRAFYLGYELKLSAKEFTVLSTIACGGGEVIDTEHLYRVLFSESGNKSIKNVAVYVCNINRKARIIGGRTRIEFSRSDGYRISESL